MGSLTASQYLSALLREQTQNFSPRMALDFGAGCAGGKLDLNLSDEEILNFEDISRHGWNPGGLPARHC